MRPLARPSDAARLRWSGLKNTIEAKAKIAKLVVDGKPLKSEDFDSEWTEKTWADAVADAQDSLCAWCTVKPPVGGHIGQVDHIRPRSAVTRDVAAAGNEVGSRSRVEGRPARPHPPLTGYHWLAYDPANLAYSCERCNVAWKRTLWPVRPWHDATAWRAPDSEIAEDELVLDPFQPTFDPLTHFQFGPYGAIIARAGDERADATIATFSLNRPVLCDARAKEYRDLVIDIRTVRRGLRDAALDNDHVPMLQRFADRCAWRIPHAASYRAALKHALEELKLSWSILRAAWDQLKLATDIHEPPDDAWVD